MASVLISDEYIFQVNELRKTFAMGQNKVHALNSVSFSVRTGEMIAIMGASGSGKSTLMSVLGCLDYPDSGSYHLDGVDVAKLNQDQLADIRNQKIGFVFQGFNLLPRTSAIENVELPLLYDRSGHVYDPKTRASDALKRVGLADRLDHKPNELSGGQQQRVAIARALVASPSILLADEPTGNLDSVTSLEVLSLFQKLNEEGVTIILVTHEHDIAEYAKRVIEMRDGQIIRDEAIAERRMAAQGL